MNREIKFRFWVPHTKEMIDDHEGWNEGIGINYALECSASMGMIIMQFIGMKDKDGKDIYEGDIGEIKTQSGRIERFLVKWGIHRRDMKSGWTVDIPGFCFEVAGFPTFPISNNYVNGHDLDIITIIGNVYQNPELISQ